MKFIVYSETNASNVATSLGMPEYSYYFVLKSYLPLLKRIGDVIEVTDPYHEVDDIFHRSSKDGIPCLFLSFSPPSRTMTTLACPTISVFAWEFEILPNESWGHEASTSWHHVLKQLPGAITHSTYSEKSVKNLMGPDYIVASIPAPVWQTHSSIQPQEEARSNCLHLEFSGYLVNSKDVSWSEIEPYVKWDRKSNQCWLQPTAEGSVLEAGQSGRTNPAGNISERNPVSSQSAIDIFKRHFNEWREDAVGDIWPSGTGTAKSIVPEVWVQDPDSREEALPAALREQFYSDRHELNLQGVIYTAVINPEDGRKNHRDIISVFAEAFRDRSDACLLLKLTHSNPDRGLSRLLAEVYRCAPFKCQIVLLASYLDDRSFRSLMNATSFVVNASHGEGQCLPLMEFMSSGIPAIAPDSTAMADYVNQANAFVVGSSREMTSWPQDPRQVLRTYRYQIDPDSLLNSYRDSYQVAQDPEKYERMSIAAVESLKSFCSLDQAERRFRQFLAELESSGVFQPLPPTEKADAGGNQWLRQRDAWASDCEQSGWFIRNSSELVRGVRITREDIVFDFQASNGDAVYFCAKAGAQIMVCNSYKTYLDQLKTWLGRNKSVICKQMEVTQLPLSIPSSSATKVLALDSLVRVEDPLAAMSELVRIGAPGAQYVLTVPAPESEKLQIQVAPGAYFEKPNHVRIFSKQDFAAIVQASGLVIESHQVEGFYSSISQAFHWVSERAAGRDPVGEAINSIRPPFHELHLGWSQTWSMLLALPGGSELKDALDRVLPSRQTIVARKPA